MLKSSSKTIQNAIITLGNTDDSGKGKHFKSRFIQPGLAGYPGQFGNALIKKENLDKFVWTLRSKPVTINHKDKIDDKDKVGIVNNVWFNPEDSWYWCDGIIFDNEAINLINNGWSVSCAYDFTKADNSGGTENNIPYDIEFLDGEFNHLALVDNPRYEGANIVFNSKVENKDRWITVHPNGEENKGRHLLLKDGETPKEAIERTYSKEKSFEKETPYSEKDKNRHQKVLDLEEKAYKEFKTIYENYIHDNDMEGWGHIKGSHFDKKVKEYNDKYQKAFKDLESDRFVSFEDFAKRENKQSDTKDKQSDEENEIKRLIESADSVSMFDSGSIEKRLNDKAIKELNNLAISEEKKQETLKQLKELHKEILKKLANAPSQYKVGPAEFNKRVGFKKSGDNLDKAYSLQAQRDNIIKQLEEEIRKEKTKQENISLGEKAKDAISKGLMEFEHNGEIWFRTSKRSKSYIGLDKYSQSKYDKMKAQNSLTDTILNAISDVITDLL